MMQTPTAPTCTPNTRRAETPGPRQIFEQAIDTEGQQRDENRAKQAARTDPMPPTMIIAT